MRSVARCCLGALAIPAIALGGCEFSDVVEIGSDRTGGSGGRRPMPGAGSGGIGIGIGGSVIGGGAGSDHGGAGAGSRDHCGVETQAGQVWVKPTATSGELTPGSGGPIEFGEYRLRGLLAHGAPTCFEPHEPLAQTLMLRGDGTGSVVSDYDDEPKTGPDFVTAFTFRVEDNAIQITPTCSDPVAPVKNPFGPFETYTAVPGGLLLVSAECSYEADYQFMLIPAR